MTACEITTCFHVECGRAVTQIFTHTFISSAIICFQASCYKSRGIPLHPVKFNAVFIGMWIHNADSIFYFSVSQRRIRIGHDRNIKRVVMNIQL